MNILTKMPKFLTQVKEFFLNLFFPANCINCLSEGNYLCQDCLSLIEISQNQYCPFCYPPKIVLDGRTCKLCRKVKNLDGLYNAASYQDSIIKKIISQFKYQPYVKELAKPVSSLIIQHFQSLDEPPPFLCVAAKDGERANFLFVPIPLTKKKLKERGFNQAEEIAKELSSFLQIPLISNCLIKLKETPAQVELPGKEREENIRGAFFCKNPEKVKDKKILLVDDVFTTGSTMEEGSRVLKEAGAREVWGIVVARE